jgi:lysophospholipase L1-like esterase
MVILAQALYVKRKTPRLPGAAGPTEGLIKGEGEPFRLAVLGESTVDGVGAKDHEEALTGCLARELARDGRAVRWQAVGRTGANARIVRAELVPLVRPADLVVVALGVNDTIELRTAAGYRRDLLAARSTALDAAAATLKRIPGVTHLPMDPRLLDPAAFASDRFHPGPAGYARWAQTLAAARSVIA